MSDTPRTITLRPLQPGETPRDGDFYMSTDGPGVLDSYREVSPIPEGYEVCDLKDATKVLIGQTWFDKVGIVIQRAGSPHYFTEEALAPLGVIAIRPPEPMNGEITIGPEARYGAFPESLVGKRVRWEVIE